jgi:hypothetical protein
MAVVLKMDRPLCRIRAKLVFSRHCSSTIFIGNGPHVGNLGWLARDHVVLRPVLGRAAPERPIGFDQLPWSIVAPPRLAVTILVSPQID